MGVNSFVALGIREFTRIDIRILPNLNLGSPTLTLPESVTCF